jgi:hypothetical protein
MLLAGNKLIACEQSMNLGKRVTYRQRKRALWAAP